MTNIGSFWQRRDPFFSFSFAPTPFSLTAKSLVHTLPLPPPCCLGRRRYILARPTASLLARPPARPARCLLIHLAASAASSPGLPFPFSPEHQCRLLAWLATSSSTTLSSLRCPTPGHLLLVSPPPCAASPGAQPPPPGHCLSATVAGGPVPRLVFSNCLVFVISLV
jgi:hypothetical protein